MLESFASNVITTKTKSMYGKRITTDDYKELVKKRNLAEIASYLKHQTRYSTSLMTLQETSARRNQLEELLNRDLFYRYLKLVHYDTNKKDSFYSYIITTMDIRQILGAIKYLNSGQSETIIEKLPAFSRSYSKVDIIKLAGVRNAQDLIDVLAGTPYAAIIQYIYSSHSENEKINIVACEIALRTYAHDEMIKFIDKHYKGSNNKDLKTIFDTQIEIYNITAIYRLKMFYNLDSTAIKKYLIPVVSRIPKSKMIELLESKSAEEFIEMLSKSKYGKYFDHTDYTFIEYTTESIKYHLSKRYLNYSNFAPICFAAYMVLSEIEIENLTTIIEGVKYDIPPEQIEKLLII